MKVQSQFIEMFDFHELNLNSPSKDFESMCLDDTSSATKIPAAEYLQEGKYAVYDQAQEKDIAGYSNTEQGLCRNYPAVLFGDHSRVVKYINEPFFIGADGVKIIRPRKDNLIPEFLYYDLKYHNIPNTGYNRHFKYIKMISLTKASLEEQSQFLSIAHQVDKSKFVGFKSQFIEMFKEAPRIELGKMASFINGSAFKPEEWSSDGLPIVRIQNLTQDDSPYNYYDGDTTKKIVIDNGDMLVSWSATLGVFLWSKGKALLNQHIFKVSFDKLDVNKDFFVYAVKLALDKMSEVAHGSTMRHVVKKDFNETIVANPSINDQESFALIAKQADKSKYYYQIA